jgi:oligopeptide/dipeptide ABC transporter ATP-binding protein
VVALQSDTWKVGPAGGRGAGPLLSVRRLCTEFVSPDGVVSRALDDVSFDVYPGQTLGLVGESGCGKTTTMLSLMRLLPSAGRISGGEVWFDGVDLLSLNERDMRRYRWKEIAMVFQSAMNALNPVYTVADQIKEAMLLHGTMDAEHADARVDELLDMVGIARSRRDQFPHQYSGGMRQRAMIAMALACLPRLLFADEPTTALDVMVQAQVLQLLQRIQSSLELAVVLVTHDLGVVAEVCDSVVVMYGGQVAEYGPIDRVYNAPQHPYTQRLLEAFPDLNRPGDSLAAIPGHPPRLNALPPGCRFEPRCHKRLELCASVQPRLIDVSAEPVPENGLAALANDRATAPWHVAACHLCRGPEARS